MSRWVACLIWALLVPPMASLGQEQDDLRGLEIRLVGPPGGEGQAFRQAVAEDLQRTRRRHSLVAVAQQDFAPQAQVDDILALFELDLDAGLSRPTLRLARAGDAVSPGWLVHAVLRAGTTVGVPVEVVDERASWLAQLVERSTRSAEPKAADKALAHGLPAVKVVLPAADPSATRLIAATVRRLDGLDGYPVFEDEYLVVGDRVLLRRDLYWVGLVLWLVLFWRTRQHPGREFRWLLLAAWLVAPVHAVLLLTLPALVATWRPARRWPVAMALLPSVAFTLLLALAVAGPAALRVSAIPALLMSAALAAFIWHHWIHRDPSRPASMSDPGASADGGKVEDATVD